MLVQGRDPDPEAPASAAPKKTHLLKPSHLNGMRFSEPKSLDFSTWFSENLYRIVFITFLVGTLGAVFFLWSTGDAFAFFQSRVQPIDQAMKIPRVNWNSIPPIRDLSFPYANFRSEKWILVSVSDYPSDPLKKLVKIKGWQVLAIGNSKTPSDWSLKGAIYLSLESQAKLGFRVVDFVQYDSYLRKNVGYLFAIQHGAKVIFDTDDRGEVIDGDLGKHFDVELSGEQARQESVLQYSHENVDRSVVNPYIHFGQRSVWPRGLPLENVGEIGNEEYYTEIFGGKQFIQQGISNGLPDVDSVFYFTRKTKLEPFDIRFDEKAPKVVLPQGLLLPMNSFNTLYHSPAFWGLMLPVSVSTMASDVLRGYWAQRILWEIGGHAAVYPPTLHRFDRIEGYPFAEEKDLHVNVGRLIKFLISWRSSKHTLFAKALDLSYAMAEEGFWGDLDVKFTAAWLQDLLAVGYKQPRLMSVELDGPRAVIGHGDKREFIPKKLPSVHLGVEETGTVSTEIGNLIRWRKSFGNVVLVMFCDGAVERTALEWRLLYGRIFKTVIILSHKEDKELVVQEANLNLIYKHLPRVFDLYKGADGFLFLQDNTVLNYWNLLQADLSKLWTTYKVPESWVTVVNVKNDEWIKQQAEMVKRVVNTMPVHFQVNYKETMKQNDEIMLSGSEIFYVPRRFVGDFGDLVGIVGDVDLHLKVAIPMFMMAMDTPQNYDGVLDNMVYRGNVVGNLSLYNAEAAAVCPFKVNREQEFIKLVRVMAEGDPLLMELV